MNLNSSLMDMGRAFRVIMVILGPRFHCALADVAHTGTAPAATSDEKRSQLIVNRCR